MNIEQIVDFATATTAEYLGARKGLGIWLQAAYNSFRTPLIFSATLVIIAITLFSTIYARRKAADGTLR